MKIPIVIQRCNGVAQLRRHIANILSLYELALSKVGTYHSPELSAPLKPKCAHRSGEICKLICDNTIIVSNFGDTYKSSCLNCYMEAIFVYVEVIVFLVEGVASKGGNSGNFALHEITVSFEIAKQS